MYKEKQQQTNKQKHFLLRNLVGDFSEALFRIYPNFCNVRQIKDIVLYYMQKSNMFSILYLLSLWG